ncbi:Rv3235 family protein [Amnibacterium endophyticum]|uniref:Rv3235 family protein n=1 Tax=Amnibacterium endophyticum TaxID=2109337 RepID=A0ABW4LBK7_9MICO
MSAGSMLPFPPSAPPADEFFARQFTPSSSLPDPTVLIENLALGVVEVLGGVRDLEQLGRWLTEPVYKLLLRRSVLAARGRAARRQSPARPKVRIASRRLMSPADGVIEATVVLTGAARTRAIAIRLEGIDHRWRATALHVL